MRWYTLLLLITFLLINNGDAQNKFQRTYGGIGSDEGQSVVVTPDSGFVILSHSTSFSSPNSNVMLMKLDKQGNVKWTRSIGVLQNDYVRYLAQTRDSGFVISGYASDESGTASPLMIKTTSLGNVEWARTYSNGYSGYSFCAQQCQEGGYILAGYGQTGGNGWDGLLIKTDSLGRLLWQNFYGNSSTDGLDHIVELSDGSFVASGWTTIGFQTLGFQQNADSWLIKIDNVGKLLWSKTYGGPSDDELQVVIPSKTGGFLATGRTTSYGAGLGDILLIKTNGDGTLQWANCYGGSNDEQPEASMIENQDGTIILTGVTSSFGPVGKNFFFLKVDSLGAVLNFHLYGGSNDEDGRAVRRTLDNGYVLVGWTQSFGNASHKIFVVKADSNGVSSCNDITASPAVTNVFIANYHGAANLNQQDTLFQQSNVEPLDSILCSSDVILGAKLGQGNSVPRRLNLSQNYPNPFNPSTSFDVEVPQEGFVTIVVYNEVGQIVDRLVQHDLGAGTHRVNWAPEGLSTGVYFYQLQINNIASMSKKMILLK